MTKTTINMATFPPRKEGLRRRLIELSPQCDSIRIYLNGYSEWPSDIALPSNCEYVLGDGLSAPDRGSQGKMYWIDPAVDEWYLTVDDDIQYPGDYAEKAIEGCSRYGGRAVTSFHGGSFRTGGSGVLPPDVEPRRIRKLITYSCFEAFDHAVQLVGNGIMCCHPKTLGLTRDALVRGPVHSGDDEDVAIWCQKNRVPCVVIRHAREWLVADDVMSTTQPQYANKHCTDLQNAKLRAYRRWTIFDKPEQVTETRSTQ